MLNIHPHSRQSGLGVPAQPVEIEHIAFGVQPRERAREPVVDHPEKGRPASPFHRGSRPLFFRRRSGRASARAPGSADAVQCCRALRRLSQVPLRCARSNATTPPRSRCLTTGKPRRLLTAPAAAVGAPEEAQSLLVPGEGIPADPYFFDQRLVSLGRPIEVAGLDARARRAEK